MAVLLGRQSAGATGDFSAPSNTAAWNFTAVASGQLVNIFAQTKSANAASSGWRLGIYANSAGLPAARLGVASVTVGSPTGTGVFGAVISPSVTIVQGTVYWLAWYATDVDGQITFVGDSGGSYFEVASDFPNPFGSAAGPSAVNAILWGESLDTAPVPTRRVRSRATSW